MAATKKQLVDDVELRLTQGKPSADFEIPKVQIERWVDIARDKYITEYIIESMKVGGVHSIDPIYIEQATGTVTAVAGIGHKSAALAANVLDIPPNDAGMVQLRMYKTSSTTYTKVLKSDIFTNDLIEDMEFSASTLAKPTYYRIGTDVYVKGLGSITVGDYAIHLEYIQGMTGGTTDYSVADNHAFDIALMAEELGRRELGMPVVADEVNDGSQNSQLNSK